LAIDRGFFHLSSHAGVNEEPKKTGSINQWMGLRAKAWSLPPNLDVSCKFSLKSIKPISTGIDTQPLAWKT